MCKNAGNLRLLDDFVFNPRCFLPNFTFNFQKNVLRKCPLYLTERMYFTSRQEKVLQFLRFSINFIPQYKRITCLNARTVLYSNLFWLQKAKNNI